MSIKLATSQPPIPARRELRFGEAWPYSPAKEGTSAVRLKERYEHFIGGERCAPQAGAYYPTLNPATEEPLAEVARGDEADVARAVQAARQAFGPWSQLPGLERGKYLFRIARAIQERARELAIVESLDGGKPIKESRDFDVPQPA